MNTDFVEVNAFVQLILDQRQQALDLLHQVQQQNQVLLILLEQQQVVLAQRQQTIDRLEADLQQGQANRQQAFRVVHSN